VLDWVENPEFPQQLTMLLKPTGAVVSPDDRWMPKGHFDDREARLEQDGELLLPGSIDWSQLRDWWLVHNGRANTPNWDLAASCTVEGQRALVLVEAKAHVSELSSSGKPLDPAASAHSVENDKRIGAAIREASAALNQRVPGVELSRDSHYQLSNRVAFSWKLASLGVNTILVYLGFVGDRTINDRFTTEEHWSEVFVDHAGVILPRRFLNERLDCGAGWMHMLVRPLRVPGRVWLAN